MAIRARIIINNGEQRSQEGVRLFVRLVRSDGRPFSRLGLS